MTTAFDPTVELQHLHRCVELATEALETGDEPFGSVLVAADGTILAGSEKCLAMRSAWAVEHKDFLYSVGDTGCFLTARDLPT